jgi:hypothetical protein
MVRRFRLAFSESEIGEERVWTSKSIEDCRNRVIGLVELELRKRREKGGRGELKGQILTGQEEQQESTDPVLQSV